MAHKFLVYVGKNSLNRNEKAYDNMGLLRLAFRRIVVAENRLDAIAKCMPEIGILIDTIEDPTIKYVSVYAGQYGSPTGAADRLSPVQIIVSSKTIRPRL